MSNKRIGRRTVELTGAPVILSCASIGGKLEKRGPLAACFDELREDSFFGEKTWEKAESRMQQRAVQTALDKAKLQPADVDCIFAGDLLNQCIGSSSCGSSTSPSSGCTAPAPPWANRWRWRP